MDYKTIFNEMMTGKKYYTSRDLIYNTNVGILMTPYDYKQLLDSKQKSVLKKSKLYFGLDLKAFDDFAPFFFIPSELLSAVDSYLGLVLDDAANTETALSFRNANDIIISRIYSEVEGTLNIESIPTTRKAVVEIASGKRDPRTLNERIIKNMIDGIDYINSCPEFTDENLFKLYNLLSYGCLDDEDILLNGNHYRHDGVEIGRYKGCPVGIIKECMDSLFVFINANLKNRELYLYLPHIAHYYILYIHPYFDYNGRTARMVSYWISLLVNKNILPPVISEAINQTKTQYYSAITETRDSQNDLTYFLLYIYKISIKYFLVYKNLENIEQVLKNKSIILTNAEKAHYKKILIYNKGKFTHEDFTKWVDINMTKQGALKILNSFCDYELLSSEMTKSNKKLFKVNEKLIIYKD